MEILLHFNKSRLNLIFTVKILFFQKIDLLHLGFKFALFRYIISCVLTVKGPMLLHAFVTFINNFCYF